MSQCVDDRYIVQPCRHSPVPRSPVVRVAFALCESDNVDDHGRSLSRDENSKMWNATHGLSIASIFRLFDSVIGVRASKSHRSPCKATVHRAFTRNGSRLITGRLVYYTRALSRHQLRARNFVRNLPERRMKVRPRASRTNDNLFDGKTRWTLQSREENRQSVPCVCATDLS